MATQITSATGKVFNLEFLRKSSSKYYFRCNDVATVSGYISGSIPKLTADAGAPAQAIAKTIGIELPKKQGLEIRLTEQQAKQLTESEKELGDFKKIANIETIGFYLAPNMMPYLDGIHYSELPEDMARVLLRARNKGELKLGIKLSGTEAAELVAMLYEKYNDVEHDKKLAKSYTREKQEKQDRLDSQDEYKDER